MGDQEQGVYRGGGGGFRGEYRGGGRYQGGRGGGGGRHRNWQGRGGHEDHRGGRGGGSGLGKRNREPEPVFDEAKQLLRRLVTLGDRRPGQEHAEEEEGQQGGGGEASRIALAAHQLPELVKSMKRSMATRPEALQEDILECTVQLSYKVQLYATLIGLLNLEDFNFVQGLLNMAGQQVCSALRGGDMPRARLLLRLFAALAVPNVVHSSSVVGSLRTVVEAANELAAGAAGRQGTSGEEEPGGDEDPEGRLWQPYGDALVGAVLMALPWGGAELCDSAPQETGRLFEDVERYMQARPRQSRPGLHPFFEPLNEGDRAASSDCGSASYLGDLWPAAQQCREAGQWAELGVEPTHEAFQAQLAAGQPHDAPQLEVPSAPSALPQDGGVDERAAWMLSRFPPRGTVRLLPPSYTLGQGRPPLARYVAEDIILDTINYWDGNRVECAVRLGTGLPLSFKYEPLLAELLFGQMLCVPHPPVKLLGYFTLMVDLCRLMPTFPRSMSACVRECFARCRTTYPDLEVRLAQWLAYHLSNFEYVWPWDKWAHVLTAPAHDAQRRFVTSVLSYLMRLSYYDRVHSSLPESFRQLLPPKPEPKPLGPPPRPPRPPPGDPPGATPAPGAANGDGAEPMDAEGGGGSEQKKQQQQEEEEQQPLDAETRVGMAILNKVRAKLPAEELRQWAEEEGLSADVGGPLPLLRCLLRALLAAGAKSFTHMVILLERYYPLLAEPLQQEGEEAQRAELAMVDAAVEVWSSAPQRAAMSVDRLLALRLASPVSVVGWVFGHSRGARCCSDEVAAGLAYELLAVAADKAAARAQDGRDELRSAQRGLAEARTAADDADVRAEEARTAAEQARAAAEEAQAAIDAAADAPAAMEDADAVGEAADATVDATEQAAALVAARERSDRAAAHATSLREAVQVAEQEVEAKRAMQEEADSDQRALVLAAARGFIALLSCGARVPADLPQEVPEQEEKGQQKQQEEGDKADNGGDTEVEPSAEQRLQRLQQEATDAWRAMTTARLQGFLRTYYMAVAPLAGKLRSEVFAQGAVEGSLREAVLEVLDM